jgi:4a-hydroxytetrahydrobiopterin dehydratase
LPRDGRTLATRLGGYEPARQRRRVAPEQGTRQGPQRDLTQQLVSSARIAVNVAFSAQMRQEPSIVIKPLSGSPMVARVEGGIGMTSVLAEKTCTPCRGGTPPLTVEEAEAYRVQAPKWLLRDETTRIERTYRFRNFGDAFAFVRSAGGLAEAEFHHPDISFGWGYATVSLRTKKIRGLHENDFIMAVKLDRLADEISTADNQASNSGGHQMPNSAY